MAQIRSPITGKSDVTVERSISCDELISEYARIFKIDISPLIKGNDKITLVRCNESGYRFYYPFDIIGDSFFYQTLASNDWYYMPNKWEFAEAIKHIPNMASILELGSAKGDFLHLVQQSISKVKCTGLELNQDAATVACGRGLDVVVESSTTHASTHSGQYDVVASFQMLEHISNPLEVLRDALVMLKPGGKLIISVPDNSYRTAKSIFLTTENILNMPPHHQGLWDIISLSNLQKVLPVKLEYIAVEPATASHHSTGYRRLVKQDLINRFGRLLGFAVYAMGRPFYNHALQHLNKYLPGHSVLSVFQKITST